MGIIMMISLIIYAVAAISIYHNIYSFEKNEKIKFIIFGFAVVLFISIIICNISTSIVPNSNGYEKILKNTAILLAAPINSIICIPYIGNVINKYKVNIINEKQLRKRIIIEAIVIGIIVIFEIGYIKNFEIGLLANGIRK